MTYQSPTHRIISLVPLSPVLRDVVYSVLQDCADQLRILGGIVPNYATKPSALDCAMGEELIKILEVQRDLEQQFSKMALDRGSPATQQLKDHAYSVNVSTQVARNCSSVKENLQKLQREREQLQELINNTMSEVLSEGTFSTLTSWIFMSNEEKWNMEQAILKEEQSKNHIRQLKRRIFDLKKEREEEMTQLNEQIAHLRDQLQELKAKNALEAKQVKKECLVNIEMTQRQNTNTETSLAEQEVKLRKQLAEECLVSQKIEDYLKKHYEDLAGNVDHWMTKHEHDLDIMSKDLHELKQNRAATLNKSDDLTKLYNDYEVVVLDHRTMKEKLRMKEEQEQREELNALKLQAWWRGMMVRKKLGPYSKRKKKKKGKGRKGKKGKTSKK